MRGRHAHRPDPLVNERLDDLAASFRRDLRAAGKSDRTLEVYSQAVRFFSAWLEAQGRPSTLDQLTRHAIKRWLAELAETKQPGTVLTRFKSMRRFVRWLVAEDEIDTDVMTGVEQPVPPEKPVPIVTDEEIDRLLKTCSTKSLRDRRDEAMLRVFIDCGLRISEAAGMTVDDLDLDLEVLRVMGKGSRPRAVPFGAKTARSIDRYLRARRQHPQASSASLRLGQRGGLSRDGVDDIIRVRAAQAGLEGLHAHRFRHTFAHRWLAAGGQERDLMRLAGWRSDEMLSRVCQQHDRGTSTRCTPTATARGSLVSYRCELRCGAPVGRGRQHRLRLAIVEIGQNTPVQLTFDKGKWVQSMRDGQDATIFTACPTHGELSFRPADIIRHGLRVELLLR